MRQTDIAVVGGGLAGSLAAAMLGRAGIDAVLVDPHPVYPPEFRCEKLEGSQVEILRKTGLAEAVLRATAFDGQVWLARFGHLLDIAPSDQYGIMYDTLVNTLRAEIPPATDQKARLGHPTPRQEPRLFRANDSRRANAALPWKSELELFFRLSLPRR